MRPKVVVITLIAAFAVLGMVAVIKGIKNPGVVAQGGDNPAVIASSSPATNDASGTGSGAAPGSVAPVPASDKVREVLLAKALDEIQSLTASVDGTNNPVVIAALLTKLADPEPDVRKAVLDALRQINDTNAVPGLQQAADATKDAREKVAMLDTIDYLKLPSTTEGVPPELQTNSSPAVISPEIPPDQRMNPKFLHKARKPVPVMNSGQTAQPATVPQ